MVHDVYKKPYGSTLNDLTHFGIRQGGNKSTLAYRNDIGIPGYTGFNPGCGSLPPQPKGNTIRTGKVVDEDARVRATMERNNQHTHSMYRNTFSGVKPDDYHAASMHGNTAHQQEDGGYWIEKASMPGPPKKFTAKSTYQDEMLNAPQTQAKAFDMAATATMTTHPYTGGIRRASGQMGATGARTVRTAPAAFTTEKGDMIGYKTMYSSMVLQEPLTGGSAAPGRPRVPSQKPANRSRVLPYAMPSRMHNSTTYVQNHGTYGHDPMTRAPTGKHDMTLTATTNDINMGTSRTTHHIPGYGGFLPSSTSNSKATSQAMGAVPRESAKVDMLLYSLDQYSRERDPKYQGSRPQANPNIRLDEKPSMETTQGLCNYQTFRREPPTVDRSKFTNSNKGCGSFFTDGGAFKSDNGKHEADRYYIGMRPIEGHPRMQIPSSRTVYGGRFPA